MLVASYYDGIIPSLTVKTQRMLKLGRSSGFLLGENVAIYYYFFFFDSRNVLRIFTSDIIS